MTAAVLSRRERWAAITTGALTGLAAIAVWVYRMRKVA